MNEISIETPKGMIRAITAGPAKGPVVIGIHGWSQKNGRHTWQPLVEPLGTAGYRVISVDMPGWGDSPKWDKTAGKSAVVAILDTLGVAVAHGLLGKSWGGGVALDFGMNYPNRVQKLILTAPAFRGDPTTLHRLTQPVLMAWAENDQTIPYQFGTALASEIPNLQFETYALGGHEAAQYNWEDFAPKAITFLDKN